MNCNLLNLRLIFTDIWEKHTFTNCNLTDLQCQKIIVLLETGCEDDKLNELHASFQKKDTKVRNSQMYTTRNLFLITTKDVSK